MAREQRVCRFCRQRKDVLALIHTHKGWLCRKGCRAPKKVENQVELSKKDGQ